MAAKYSSAGIRLWLSHLARKHIVIFVTCFSHVDIRFVIYSVEESQQPTTIHRNMALAW